MREYGLDRETAESHAVVREVKKYYEEDDGLESIWWKI